MCKWGGGPGIRPLAVPRCLDASFLCPPASPEPPRNPQGPEALPSGFTLRGAAAPSLHQKSPLCSRTGFLVIFPLREGLCGCFLKFGNQCSKEDWMARTSGDMAPGELLEGVELGRDPCLPSPAHPFRRGHAQSARLDVPSARPRPCRGHSSRLSCPLPQSGLVAALRCSTCPSVPPFPLLTDWGGIPEASPVLSGFHRWGENVAPLLFCYQLLPPRGREASPFQVA